MKLQTRVLALVLSIFVCNLHGFNYKRLFSKTGRFSAYFSSLFKSNFFGKFGGMKNAQFFRQWNKRVGGDWQRPIAMGGFSGLAGLAFNKNVQENKKQTMKPATVWARVAAGQEPSAHTMKEMYNTDCTVNEYQNLAIPQHSKNNDTVRVATYNVHFFRDALNNKSFDEVVNTIKTINADVVILQEVSIFDETKIRTAFAKIGYVFDEKKSFCKSMDAWGRPFGNMVLSKYPFIQEPAKNTFEYDKRYAGTIHCWGEQRCYVQSKIALPNGKKISVYGTHLDVYDETDSRRLEQIKELVANANKDSVENIIIAADFNAVRSRDYQYTVNNKYVWDMVNQSTHNRFWINTPTKALEAFDSNQFQDSFAKCGSASPKWTVWTGTAVDFMYLNKQWNLPVVGSWVYYSKASDHLPVIMDVKVS